MAKISDQLTTEPKVQTTNLLTFCLLPFFFCLLALESQVNVTPNNVAVIFEEQQLTYQELNNRANQLAHYLQSMGVRPDVLVGICMERSLNMVVGLLGILKAGGAYVPLDPAYPQERLAFMIEDSHLSILLTDSQAVESLRMPNNQLAGLPPERSQVVCLNTQDLRKRDREAFDSAIRVTV